MRKIKNMKLSGMLALAMAVVLLVGSLAYFTDRLTTKATISTIGADITTDPDDPTYKDDLTAKWLAFNAAPKANFNPGDKVDLSYKLANTGELALDVRETFIITSSKPMSATPEFRLFNGATQDAGTKAYTGNGVVVTETKISDTVYKYTVASYVLSGSEETIGSNAKSVDKTYQLVFDKTAGNAFQGATCTIDYLVEAKQHSDGGDADWVTAVNSGTITLGGQTIPAVPAKPAP